MSDEGWKVARRAQADLTRIIEGREGKPKPEPMYSKPTSAELDAMWDLIERASSALEEYIPPARAVARSRADRTPAEECLLLNCNKHLSLRVELTTAINDHRDQQEEDAREVASDDAADLRAGR